MNLSSILMIGSLTFADSMDVETAHAPRVFVQIVQHVVGSSLPGDLHMPRLGLIEIEKTKVSRGETMW